MYYVYVLESLKDGNYYIGTTKDLARRLNEHNSGHSKSTSPRRPFKLVYSEEFEDIKKAYSRERFLKSKKSRNTIQKIIKGQLGERQVRPEVADRNLGIWVLEAKRKGHIYFTVEAVKYDENVLKRDISSHEPALLLL